MHNINFLGFSKLTKITGDEREKNKRRKRCTLTKLLVFFSKHWKLTQITGEEREKKKKVHNITLTKLLSHFKVDLNNWGQKRKSKSRERWITSAWPNFLGFSKYGKLTPKITGDEREKRRKMCIAALWPNVEAWKFDPNNHQGQIEKSRRRKKCKTAGLCRSKFLGCQQVYKCFAFQKTRRRKS